MGPPCQQEAVRWYPKETAWNNQFSVLQKEAALRKVMLEKEKKEYQIAWEEKKAQVEAEKKQKAEAFCLKKEEQIAEKAQKALKHKQKKE